VKKGILVGLFRVLFFGCAQFYLLVACGRELYSFFINDPGCGCQREGLP